MYRAANGLYALLHLNWHTTLLTAIRYQAAACTKSQIYIAFLNCLYIDWEKHMLRRNICDIAKFEKARRSAARLGGFLHTFDKTLPNEQPAGYCRISERVIAADLKKTSLGPDALFPSRASAHDSASYMYLKACFFYTSKWTSSSRSYRVRHTLHRSGGTAPANYRPHSAEPIGSTILTDSNIMIT